MNHAQNRIWNEDLDGQSPEKCQCEDGLTVVTVYETGKTAQKFTITCAWCGGTGYLTPKQKAEKEHYQNMWCECPESEDDYDWRFCPDKSCPSMRKHHYHCQKCGKITQVG